MKAKAAAWDTADDKWEETGKSIESAWDDWTDRAAKAWDELKK